MVGSLYLSKASVTNLLTMDDFPTPVSPNSTTFTSRVDASAILTESGVKLQRNATRCQAHWMPQARQNCSDESGQVNDLDIQGPLVIPHAPAGRHAACRDECGWRLTQ